MRWRGAPCAGKTQTVERIHRAHAQKHTVSKQNWGKHQDVAFRKPWFCKLYQTGQCTQNKDHDLGEKTHRHVCAHCLQQGRILPHPEKYCQNKSQFLKNEQGAAQAGKLGSNSTDQQITNVVVDTSFNQVGAQPVIFTHLASGDNLLYNQSNCDMSKKNISHVHSSCFYRSDLDKTREHGLMCRGSNVCNLTQERQYNDSFHHNCGKDISMENTKKSIDTVKRGNVKGAEISR